MERDRRVAHPVAQSMVETARRLIGERGVAGTTTRGVELATRGRRGQPLGPGSTFYYFGTKERLLVEVLRVDLERRLALLRARVRSVESLEDLLGALEEGVDAFAGENPASHVLLCECVGAPLRHETLADAQAEGDRRWSAELAGMLLELEQRGVVRVGARAAVLADLFTAAAQGAGIHQVADPEWDRRAVVAIISELLGAAALRA